MYLDADPKKCTGCRVCLAICSLYHFKEVNPKKGALKIEGKFPVPGTYEPIVCNQCGTCASVCPVEAISKTKDGVYIIDAEKCNGCGACVEACPRQVMILHEDSPVPIKCDLCKECIPMCAPGALFLSGK